jgi:hypothetical protein
VVLRQYRTTVVHDGSIVSGSLAGLNAAEAQAEN